MEDELQEQQLPRFASWIAALLVSGLLLGWLSRFGIWDPAEIEVADLARRLSEGESPNLPHWGPWLVSRGFAALGVHEWSGRLPIALGGVAAVLLTYALAARFAGRRAALYALVIAGTSPLLVLNARTMLGEAPSLAVQAAIVLCGCYALFGGAGERAGARTGWLLATVALGALGVAARGALLGALPPLLALCGAAVLDGKLAREQDRTGRALAAALCCVTLALAVQVALHAFADRAAPDPWLGGQPIGGEPPGFDAVLERVFHAFAPWSALLPLALAQMPKPPLGTSEGPSRDERRLRLLVVLWLAAAYAALTLFLSRYGRNAATIPVSALAIAVALFLREVERTRTGHWPAALGAALLASLLVRDYAKYPESPLHALPLSEFKLPEKFDPELVWAVALFGFGALAVLALVADAHARTPLDLLAPYRWLARQWRRGLGYKLWLIAMGAALVGLLVFGVLSWLIVPGVRLSVMGRSAGRFLGCVPPLLPFAVALVQLALFAANALSRARMVPLLLAGVGVGAYTGYGFMGGLSEQFSPREVYETYNALAREGEPLIEYRVGARTAAYYAKGNAIEVESMTDLTDELVNDQRRWLVFPSEELANIDRAFRLRSHRHLFVADARSAKIMLATNQPIAGRKDKSPISEFVRKEAPAKIQHPVAANFEDRIQLLGYDLALPHGDHVGGGESFEITWYFKVLKTIPGAYRIFVHIDESTMRIHGDHDPIDGLYPVRMWDVGDVIADRQTIEVPASDPAGDYIVYLGFYSGETRLIVKEGPKDDANRVRAGVLRIR